MWSFYVMDEAINLRLQLVSNVFDFLTKALVVYFICVRLIFTMNYVSGKIKWMWIMAIVSGVLISLTCNIVLSLSLFIEIDALLTTIWYQLADFYISVLEVFSLISYIRHRFSAKNFEMLYEVLNRLMLVRSFVIMILSAVGSFVLLVTAHIGYDVDLNFNGSIAAIKYAITCQLVLEVFSSTIKTKLDKSEIADAVGSRRAAGGGSHRMIPSFSSNRPRGQSEPKPGSQKHQQPNRVVGSLQLSDDDLQDIPEELNIKFDASDKVDKGKEGTSAT